MPYANVYIKSNPKIGTVTNQEGTFNLMLPGESTDTIVVSYIGFQSQLKPVKEVIKNTNLTIRLAENEVALNEVVVMPVDTLTDLLRKAFARIESNYSKNGKLIRGFYREANQLIPENKFVYFSESVLEFYKPGYGNKLYGPVRIVEGGKAELPHRDKYSNVYFYAGPYVAQRFDFVKEREEFINPDFFDRYTYEMIGQTTNEQRPVYIIKFSPNENAQFEGKFYLDKETLAYIAAEYKLSPRGIRKVNGQTPNAFDFKERHYLVKYKLTGREWNIFMVVQDGVGFNESLKNEVRYTNEYISTAFEEVSKNPIQESDAIPFSGIYTLQKGKFADSFWNEPATVTRTKELDSTVNFLFHKKDLKIESNNGIPLHNESFPKKSRLSQLTTTIANRTSSGISVGYAPVSVLAGNYTLDYNGYFSVNNNQTGTDVVKTVTLDLKYSINNSLAVATRFSSSLNSAIDYSLITIGCEWSKTIAGWRRPLYFIPGINFYHSTLETRLLEFNPQGAFVVDGTRINSAKISAGIGEVRYGFMPSLQFVYKFGLKLALYGEALSSVLSWQQDKMFVAEKSGFFLGRKSASLAIADDRIQLTKDGTTSVNSDRHLENYRLLVNVGIRIGLK